MELELLAMWMVNYVNTVYCKKLWNYLRENRDTNSSTNNSMMIQNLFGMHAPARNILRTFTN